VLTDTATGGELVEVALQAVAAIFSSLRSVAGRVGGCQE
jgi:hypothetical protein